MKFAFITLSIVIVGWSANAGCDSADLYPGIQYDSPFKQDEDFSPLFPESEPLPSYRASLPWTRDRKPTKPTGDRLLQMQEMLERRRQQYKMQTEKQLQQILDDPRQYVNDEYLNGELASAVEEVNRMNMNIDADEDPYREPPPFNGFDYNSRLMQPIMPLQPSNVRIDDDEIPRGHMHNMHSSHKNPKIGKVKTHSNFANVEFVKDPTDFAYPPTDPHFFEDTRSKQLNAYNKQGEDINDDVAKYGKVETTSDDDEEANYKPNPKFDEIQNSKNDYILITPKDYHQQMAKNTKKGGLLQNEVQETTGELKAQNDEDDVDIVAIRRTAGIYMLAVIAGISAATLVTLTMMIITYFNLQKHVKNASDVEYPAYGVTGPNKEVSPSGDRRLAQSAQMYHYQHQKQQIIAMERAAANERHGSISEADSDEENEEGDYTVYECPGLAPTGEMEVKNPLFQDDPTPAQTPHQKQADSAKEGTNLQKK